jgi:hypothetical protein
MIPVELLAVKVSGEGVMAEFCRTLVQVFEPLVKLYDFNTDYCLPQPFQADYETYTKIGFLVSFCWFLLFFEPFALRLRIVIMNFYYPNVANCRATWLYHHILRRRTKFRKYEIAEYKASSSKKEKKKKVGTLCNCFWLRQLLGLKSKHFCVVCFCSVPRFVIGSRYNAH